MTMSIIWFHQLLLLLLSLLGGTSIASSRSKRVKLASCHIRVSNEILLLTNTAQRSNASGAAGTADSTGHPSDNSRNRNNAPSSSSPLSLSLSLSVVVVQVLAQTPNLTTTNVTRYHLDLQDCASGTATGCTTTLLFPWESHYHYHSNKNTTTSSSSKSSVVHRSQLHLLLVLQGEELVSSAIILDEARYLEPEHSDLPLPIQLTASRIANGANSEIFRTRQAQDMDITTQHDTAAKGFPAHTRIATPNIAIVLFLVLVPLLPVLLVLSIAYEPTNVTFAQLLLRTAYHCFYPAPNHDAHYYHFDSCTTTTNTSQNATNINIDQTPVSYVLVPQDRTSPSRGTKNENVGASQKQQPPLGGHCTNKVDSIPYPPTSTALLNVISTSPSFITSPPIVIRQSFYDAPTENQIRKVSSTSSKKHTGSTPSKIALSSLPTHLRKRKKKAIIPKPDGTKVITTSSTTQQKHTNDWSKNKKKNHHNLGSLARKRLKLFNPSKQEKELWTLHDDSSCKNTFAFI